MGFNLRKSINLGSGFKVNLSKSGVGYSFRVPGGRITRTASGKLKYNYTGFKTKKKSSLNDNSKDAMDYIENANIENFQSIEYRDIINKITRLLWINRFGNILVVLTLAAFINRYFIIFLGVGLILKVLVRSVLRLKLEYDLDEQSNNKFNEKIRAWLKLRKCHKLWQVISESKLTNKKAVAGINRSVVRKVIKINKKLPYFLSANTEALEIKLNKETLYILPDKILIIRGCKAGTLGFNNITIVTSETEFVESNKPSKDAKIIDYRWQYSNKDGEPDKRYKDNKKVPVYVYGVIQIISNEGLNIEIQCSNVEILNEFNHAVTVN